MGNRFGKKKRRFPREDCSMDQIQIRTRMAKRSTIELPSFSEDSNRKASHFVLSNTVKEEQNDSEPEQDESLQMNGRMRHPRTSSTPSMSRFRNRRGSLLLPFSRDDGVLTDEKKEWIRASWKAILARNSDVTTVGLRIFQKIFTYNPELKLVFQVPENLPTDQLESFEEFHRMARIFAQVLDLSVRNIYSLDSEMGPMLRMYGRRHLHKQENGFRQEYFKAFSHAIQEFVTDELVDIDELDTPIGDSLTAWRLLLAYIVSKMTEGLQLESLQLWRKTSKKKMLS